MPKYSLDSVTIDGFRGLKQLRLDDLGLINILVGRNNSGKTSVLEALSILCSPLDPIEWISMIRRRDSGQLDETQVQSLRWCSNQSVQLVDPEFLFEGECTMSCGGRFPLQTPRITRRDIIGEPDIDRKLYGSYYEALRRLRHARAETDASDVEPIRGSEIKHFIERAEGEPQENATNDRTVTLRV